MDSFYCGYCKREQSREDVAGSDEFTCTNCGALLQVPSNQTLFRSATPPFAAVLESPKPPPPSLPLSKHLLPRSGIPKNMASHNNRPVSSAPASHQPRSAARQNVDRRLQEEMEAYRPKATISMKRSSMFVTGPPSPVSAGNVRTFDISGGRGVRAPQAPPEKTVDMPGDPSTSGAHPAGELNQRVTGPEPTSVSLSFGPKSGVPPRTGLVVNPPMAVSAGRDVIQPITQPQVAGYPGGLPHNPRLTTGYDGRSDYDGGLSSAESDISSASSRRRRAFFAKPVTESDLPPGTNVFVARPYVPEDDDDSPEFWSNPEPPPQEAQVAVAPLSGSVAEKAPSPQGDALPVSVSAFEESERKKRLEPSARSFAPEDAPDRNPKFENLATPPIFDEPHSPPERDPPSQADAPIAFDAAPTLRQLSVGRTPTEADQGRSTTPPPASGPPPMSPTFQRAMLEYQRVRAMFGGKKHPDPSSGGVENAEAPCEGLAPEGEESEQEVFEEIDLDDGNGAKEESAGGFKSGFKKLAVGMEGLLRGKSVNRGSDSGAANRSQETLRQVGGSGGIPQAGISGGADTERTLSVRSLPTVLAESVDTEGDLRASVKSGEENGTAGKIVVPRGMEISSGVPAPVTRAVSEPVNPVRGAPYNSSFRGVAQDANVANASLGSSSRGLVGDTDSGAPQTGGLREGSFRGGAQVSRAGNYGSSSSLGAWSDESDSEMVRTVERVPLEEGGYVIRAVMKRVPRSGRSSPLLPSSRGASPEPGGGNLEGAETGVALPGQGLGALTCGEASLDAVKAGLEGLEIGGGLRSAEEGALIAEREEKEQGVRSTLAGNEVVGVCKEQKQSEADGNAVADSGGVDRDSGPSSVVEAHSERKQSIRGHVAGAEAAVVSRPEVHSEREGESHNSELKGNGDASVPSSRLAVAGPGNGFQGSGATPGGPLPAVTKAESAPPRLGAERVPDETLPEALVAAEPKFASFKRPEKVTGLSEAKVSPPLERSVSSPETPRIRSARTKIFRPETPNRTPSLGGAGAAAIPAVPIGVSFPGNLEPGSAVSRGETEPEPERQPALNPLRNPQAPSTGAPFFPVQQETPVSPKLSISPPTDFVRWTERSLSPNPLAAPLPPVKLEITPLPVYSSDGSQTASENAPENVAKPTIGTSEPGLVSAQTIGLDGAGPLGSAFTQGDPGKAVQSRRTHSRTSSREGVSPASSEPNSPTHRLSPHRGPPSSTAPQGLPREPFQTPSAFGGFPPPAPLERNPRVGGESSRSKRRAERELAEGTWALGGAELAPGVLHSEHTFSTWLDDDKRKQVTGRGGPVEGPIAERGELVQPPRVYQGPPTTTFPLGERNAFPSGVSSPGPRVYGRTDSDLSVRTSEFEGGISSFAGSEASLDSPRSDPLPLPEFHPPQQYAELFKFQSGGPATPPNTGSPRRDSPTVPLPPSAAPLPPPRMKGEIGVSKELSFADSFKQKTPLDPDSPEGSTREGSVQPELQFWSPTQPSQADFDTPPMPGRPPFPPLVRPGAPGPPIAPQPPSFFPSPPGFRPPVLVIPNPDLNRQDARARSVSSLSSNSSPGSQQGFRPGYAEPYAANPGFRGPGLVDPQLSFSSHGSGDYLQSPGYNPGYANPDPNWHAQSFQSQQSGVGLGGPSVLAGGRGVMQPQDSIRRKGVCDMCGQKSKKTVQCLVCDKKYCDRCIAQAMGAMPEGRKCIGCVGLPVKSANRPKLGRADSTLPGFSREQTAAMLRTELAVVANQAGPEQVVVNKKPLTREELAALMKAERPPPRAERGEFWYDARSGLWGKAGRAFDRIVTPGLQVGGPLPQDASAGSTRVYINGRELSKRELRLFKFAGAKLKSNKRLWLDADGAYGEEGGPMKGNMWELRPLQLMLPLFGRPASEVETRLAKEMQLEAASRVSKILLVGPPESGKSTFARAVREMYGSGYSEEEQAGELRAMVLANVLHCGKRLLEGRKEKFDDEEGEDDQWKYALEQENEPIAARAHTAISAALGIAEMEKGKWLTLDHKLAADLQKLWRDPGVQATFRVGGDISLPDATDYFMDRVAQISAPGYVPSWDDVTACQVLHQVIQTGVTEVDFSIDDPEPSAPSPTVPFSGSLSAIYEAENPGFGASFSAGNAVPSAVYRLLDVGPGHLADGPGWRRACDMFQDVSAVLFFVGLSDFDRFRVSGGEFHNRLEDARDLFQSVLNSPSFEGKPILLLFNKFDLFCRKLRANTSLTECDWLEDYDPGDHSTASDRFREDVEAQNAYMYIERKFMALVEERNKRAPQVEVLVYKLTSVQKDSVDVMLQHLPDLVP